MLLTFAAGNGREVVVKQAGWKEGSVTKKCPGHTGIADDSLIWIAPPEVMSGQTSFLTLRDRVRQQTRCNTPIHYCLRLVSQICTAATISNEQILVYMIGLRFLWLDLRGFK